MQDAAIEEKAKSKIQELQERVDYLEKLVEEQQIQINEMNVIINTKIK